MRQKTLDTSKLYFITLLLLTINATSFAQFTLSGELRPRTELTHGFKTLAAPGQNVGIFTTQRTRLNVAYTNPNYKIGIVLLDIRTWGSESQLNLSDGNLSLHQAWLDVRLDSLITMKAGRQELVYDDHRIFGSVGWAQQARSHDVAILKYEGKIKMHFGAAFNQDSPTLTDNNYTVAKSYKAFQYLWFNMPIGESVKLSMLVLNNGVGVSSIQYSQTIGTYLKFKKKKLQINW